MTEYLKEIRIWHAGRGEASRFILKALFAHIVGAPDCDEGDDK
jgi:hypothetical protein